MVSEVETGNAEEGDVRKVTVKIEGLAPYSQSRMHDTAKLDKERPDEYEARTWREKSSYDEQTREVFIPAMAFKQALDSAAQKLGEQIPGRGKRTFTKFFLSDVICDANVPTGVKLDDVKSITINANSTGERGRGKRVKRTFPVIPVWAVTADFTVLDDTVTREVFERTLTTAGMSIGVGRFRPENGGLNGRFRPASFKWHD